MDLSPHFSPVSSVPPDHPLRVGTNLVLCHGTRHVRVLSLPDACGKNVLLGEWEGSFGEEFVVWPQLPPFLGVHHATPSAN
jgi:hypothetical protein